LSKTSRKKKNANLPGINKAKIFKAGPGRPKGSKNKITLALKEAILEAANSAHEDGMVGYLKVLARKSAAFDASNA